MRHIIAQVLQGRLFKLPGTSYTVTVTDVLSLAVGAFVQSLVYSGAGDGLQFADNTLLTISMITREAARVLVNNLTFANKVNKEYSSKFAVEGAKIGTVLNVRKPPRYEVKSGQALQLQDANEESVPVTLEYQDHVDISFSAADLLLSVDDFSKRFLSPAISAIANKIDQRGLRLAHQINHFVGTPGASPTDIDIYLLAGVKLDDSAAPSDGTRHIVISPKMQAKIVHALKGLFHQGAQISNQYLKGKMGTAVGFEWDMDQNIMTHTVGPLGGTPLVDGAGQTGSSVLLKGFTAAVGLRLRRGDVITFAGVNQVNPQSRESTGDLEQFVVTQDCYSDGNGAATVSIFPPIVTSGATQTVDAAPADSAAVLTFGHASSYAGLQSKQALAFHPDAFTFVSADLPMPKGVDMAARISDDELGISMRAIRDYSIDSDTFPCRIDVLYGWAVLRPELACRILG